MSVRIDCTECDSEWDGPTLRVYFCPLHRAAKAMLDAIKAYVAYTGHDHAGANLGMTCEACYAIKTAAANASRTWEQANADERADHDEAVRAQEAQIERDRQAWEIAEQRAIAENIDKRRGL